jgi:mannose-6-phosphate isomerase-like protein (cupin superfamily)
MTAQRAFDLETLRSRRAASESAYLEFLRVQTLSVGLYELPAGGVDPQGPHTEDEVYIVMWGEAILRIGSDEHPVSAGSVVFVEAGIEHRFVEILADLSVVVLFAPPEGSAARS